jgi:predicted kinase
MIKVLVGISGLGKSTYAQDISTDNSIVISRDKLREMLFSYNESNIKDYYSRPDFGKCEQLVTKHLEELIHYNLSKNRDVILDATHLKLKYINQIKKKFYYTDIEFIDVAKEQGCFDIRHLQDLCIERDSQRTRQVGQVVITQQIRDYQQLLRDFDFKPYFANIEPILQDKSLPKAVIFDIDGTLALKGDRSPYNWGRVDEDDLNEWVVNLYKTVEKQGDYSLIICTGRDGICENITKGWLYINDFSYDEFHIRSEGNTEPDYVIKERMWRDIASRYYIECMFDDRNQVVDHARRLGLNVAQVNYGDF